MVHIRLAISVVRSNDPRRVLRNVLGLLKLGAYLQWEELEFSRRTSQASTLLSSAEEFRRAQELTDLNSLEWVRKLPGIVEQSGFEGRAGVQVWM